MRLDAPIDFLQVLFERFFACRPAIDIDDALRAVEHERVRDAKPIEALEQFLVAQCYRVVDAVVLNEGLNRSRPVFIESDAQDFDFGAGRYLIY